MVRLRSVFPRLNSRIFRAILLLILLCVFPSMLSAQSTQGAFLGSVRDASGGAVGGAEVVIRSVAEGVSRIFLTDASGNYYAPDFKPGSYTLEVSKSGFRKGVLQDISLQARQELREDFVLQVGSVDQQVVVTDSAAGAINTENSSISASIDSQGVTDLPTNYRGNNSTSPLALVQVLPGIQPDTGDKSGRNVKFSVQGGIPSQSETTVDGISTQDTTTNSPLSDAFPSAESISEIRVDGVGNNAEYGQPGQITSVSKSGTNSLHGGLFWYHQNRAFDALAFGETSKPQKVGNDFGVTLGGPVYLPRLYDGRNKTFFFGTYEGFRFPLGSLDQEVVPTDAMRAGDFSAIVTPGKPLMNPFTGTPYQNNTLPSGSVTAASQQFLTLFPHPNANQSAPFGSVPNYITNKDNSYNSDQYDLRGDQYIGHKASTFARYTWKSIDQKQPNQLLVPSSDFIDQYNILVTSFSYNFRPTLLNEFRFGFTLAKYGSTNAFDGPGFAKKVGLSGVGPSFPFNGVTELDFSGATTKLGADRLDNLYKSRTFQFNDNLSWTKGRHSMKYGFDIRGIEAITPLGFYGADNYGTFGFNGQFTNYDFADFLLGLPSNTEIDVVKQDNDGQTRHFHLFGQDTFQVSPHLTLTYGLRWEYHPAYHDPSGNIGNFDPRVPRSGAVIYPDGAASLLAPGFLADFNACPTLGSNQGPTVNGAACTPVLSNSQANLPSGLRTASKRRFMPRFGFAYRPFGNERTAIRGGFGVYNITLLGRNFYSLTGTLQSDTRIFQNIESLSGPAYQWPAINAGGSGLGAPAYGTAYFGTANDIDWKDPYSMQWNLSVDRELGAGIGARISYIGMKTDQLVWAPNYNDMTPSTTWALARPLSDRPFPNWGTLQDRSTGATAFYNAMQLEARRSFRQGLMFNSSYTWAKNVSDNQGPQVGSFADENGGARASYVYNRHLDFGDVYGTRRHRWLTSMLYDLPVGRGKSFGRNLNRAADAIIGGWQLSNIFLWQTGPYLTPYFSGGDPSGTGSGSLYGRRQHPDRVGNPVPSNQTRNNWINVAAFVCPGQVGWIPGSPCNIGTGPTSTQAPIGRFGNSGVGIIEGPGTVNLSTGLAKSLVLTERVRLKAQVSFTNILNHTNLADPTLNIASGNFGVINSARGSDFGGNRTGQVSLRVDF